MTRNTESKFQCTSYPDPGSKHWRFRRVRSWDLWSTIRGLAELQSVLPRFGFLSRRKRVLKTVPLRDKVGFPKSGEPESEGWRGRVPGTIISLAAICFHLRTVGGARPCTLSFLLFSCWRDRQGMRNGMTPINHPTGGFLWGDSGVHFQTPF